MSLSPFVLQRMEEEFGSKSCCSCGCVANRFRDNRYFCHGCYDALTADYDDEDDGPRVFKLPSLLKGFAEAA